MGLNASIKAFLFTKHIEIVKNENFLLVRKFTRMCSFVIGKTCFRLQYFSTEITSKFTFNNKNKEKCQLFFWEHLQVTLIKIKNE